MHGHHIVDGPDVAVNGISAQAESCGDAFLRQSSVRSHAASALGALGPEAAAAVPGLIRACMILDTPNVDATELETMTFAAAGALGQMKEKAEPAVPVLIRFALDARLNILTRERAIQAIGAVGPAANRHLAALRKGVSRIEHEGLRKQLSEIVDGLP